MKKLVTPYQFNAKPKDAYSVVLEGYKQHEEMLWQSLGASAVNC